MAVRCQVHTTRRKRTWERQKEKGKIEEQRPKEKDKERNEEIKINK
jgi:hypothetical protein